MSGERWRYVGLGAIGHVWHDTATGRYVISDELGPEGDVRRGVKHHEHMRYERHKFEERRA
jgi:hypothetical protein